MTRRKKGSSASFSGRLTRYALTGAAIGLYFGYFFRPAREPSWSLVLGLSVVATLVTVGLRLARRRRGNNRHTADAGRSAAGWLKVTAILFGQYLLVLATLDARHLAFDFGGRPAVMLWTSLMGGLTGVWLAYGSRVVE